MISDVDSSCQPHTGRFLHVVDKSFQRGGSTQSASQQCNPTDIIFGVLLGLSPARSDAQGLGQLYIEVLTASGAAIEGLTPDSFSIMS